MLILKVSLSVITDNPISKSRWRGFNVCRRNLSMQIVIEALEESITQVHVSDWVDALWEINASWELTVSMSPIVLNSLHMPLVHNYDNFLVL